MSEESRLNIYNLAVENPDSVINLRECPISVQVKHATQWSEPVNSSIPVSSIITCMLYLITT